jgi:RNA 2',3'-cyclic 3'-phosphodiesterase
VKTMSLLRTFIAVDIPPSIQTDIQQKTGALCRAIDSSLVRWVSPRNLHLTLKFLGDVSPANVNLLTQMLRAEADSCPAFDIHLNGLGSFPSPKRPRIIYIGIQAPAELEALARGIESACARLGYESEARGFSPHLTIGRVRQNVSSSEQQKIRMALEETKIDSLGTARVDSVHLYKSDLKPSGPVYTRLYSAPLHTVIASEAKQSHHQ